MYVYVGVLVFTDTCCVLGRVELSTVGFVWHWRIVVFFFLAGMCVRESSRDTPH